MHIHFLDPYRAVRSPVHRLDGRVKLPLALAFILTCALTPFGAWPVYILLLSLLLSVELASGLGIGYYQKRAALALPFVLAAVPLLFSVPGEALLRFQIGPLAGQISLPGLERFASVAVKSWLSIQAALLLTASTSFPDLLAAMRSLGLPRLLVSIVGLMWRYLFVLADEALRLNRAREARSGSDTPPGSSKSPGLIWRARVTGGMVGSLFLRAFDRSDRIYMAMLARGYDGEVRGLARAGLPPEQRRTLAGGLVILGLALALALLMGG